MFRQIRHLAAALLVLLVIGSCSKSSTAPKAPAELPNDPNAAAPALSHVNHFEADSQWVELTPTTDDVEFGTITLAYQYDPGGAWTAPYTRLTPGPIVRRLSKAYVEVVEPKPMYTPNAWLLRLNVRRTAYRTWFDVRVF